MENYIKYKRIVQSILINEDFEKNLQKFLDDLIQDGYVIIHYNEEIKSVIKQIELREIATSTLHITLLVGKINQVL